ncbi:MAG: type II toxin-antitoxin system HicB family antitoxin [Chloroflexi bacterium]|nr:type II toxin-antitoxin system HicB family antitoxin [Chloroflexota bacterium]
MKLTYAVVFEQTPNNYTAYVPDVPGCVSTGKSWDEMLAMIREALVLHIEAILENGEPLPEPKMSIDEAIASHSEPVAEDVLDSYREFGDPVPTISTRFELVEIEVPAPQAFQAG